MAILSYPIDEMRKRADAIDHLRHEGLRGHHIRIQNLIDHYHKIPDNLQKTLWIIPLAEELGFHIGSPPETWGQHIAHIYNNYYRNLAQSLRSAADLMEKTERDIAARL